MSYVTQKSSNNAFKNSAKPQEKKNFLDTHGTILGGGVLALGMILVGTQYSQNTNFKADVTDETTTEEATTTEETAPAEEETTTEETAPAEEETTTEETAPAEEETTTEVQTAENNTSAEPAPEPVVYASNDAPETVDPVAVESAEEEVPERVMTRVEKFIPAASDNIVISFPETPTQVEASAYEYINNEELSAQKPETTVLPVVNP